MTTPALHDARDAPTSAAGPMRRAGLALTIATMLATTSTSGAATSNGYEAPHPVERTTAGPPGQIRFAPAESTAEAILEIRRRSGLTWEEMSDLFDVSRRSIHHWASGKPVSARRERALRQALAAIRRLDRGDQAGTRARLLAVDHPTGVSALDMMREGRFEEITVRPEGSPDVGSSPRSSLPGGPGVSPASAADVPPGSQAGTAGRSGQGARRPCSADVREDGLTFRARDETGRGGRRQGARHLASGGCLPGCRIGVSAPCGSVLSPQSGVPTSGGVVGGRR